ncbi:phosphomevalonate kinase [Aethina tumida]|uniref:phosphomevalonate kinase n=1 Tax=Aethina tumida TaxID=116153 RepID=UPI00096AEDB4|nr:phosphomevalonate kinase [Aethina tumida]XP_049821234.1 phosphomevalonate kinase [Aethina tumida]XP_049821235.1 phosphomevalonate kinase [Aethina tumida]
MTNPKLILLMSGKRKSGKDYLCEKLKKSFEDECIIVRISGPLKSQYAKVHNLNFEDLMGDGLYKEKYRIDMINWSDEVREKEPGYFCKIATQEAPSKKIWIVSDIRRKTDIKWFKETYSDKIKAVRISADQDVREKRGWVYQDGVDNVKSECDLDDWNDWDLKMTNNSVEDGEETLQKLIDYIKMNS